MRANGHHHPYPHTDTTSILVDIYFKVGKIEANVDTIKARQAEIIIDVTELKKTNRRPLSDYMPLITAAGLLALAAAGKVSMSDVLPSLLGLAGGR